MDYKTIKEKHEKAINDIIEKYQVFFAFSNSQLADGKKKIGVIDNKELVSIGAGGFIKKINIDDFLNATEQANKDYKKELKEAKEAKNEAISYQLSNHECFYTGDISPVIEFFKGIYTKTDILKVYNAIRIDRV